MEYTGRTVLKNGEALILRSLTAADAQAAIWFLHRVHDETLNLTSYPEEIRLTTAQEAENIENASADPYGVMLGAFINEELIGLCHASRISAKERMRHRARVGVSVLRAHWGKGVAMAIMRTALELMRAAGIGQIELDVVSTNDAAIALYEKLGFVRFGCHPRAFRYRDGSYADLLLMALALREEE